MQLYNSTEKVILTGLLGTLESFVHSREVSGNLFDIHCNPLFVHFPNYPFE